MLEFQKYLPSDSDYIDPRQIKLKFAQFISAVIPAACPFERDVKFFNFMLFHIPPLCKLNPFYKQLIRLRFWSLCYARK